MCLHSTIEEFMSIVRLCGLIPCERLVSSFKAFELKITKWDCSSIGSGSNVLVCIGAPYTIRTKHDQFTWVGHFVMLMQQPLAGKCVNFVRLVPATCLDVRNFCCRPHIWTNQSQCWATMLFISSRASNHCYAFSCSLSTVNWVCLYNSIVCGRQRQRTEIHRSMGVRDCNAMRKYSTPLDSVSKSLATLSVLPKPREIKTDVCI